MILANTFAVVADDVFGKSPGSLHTLAAWGGAMAYALQLYLDFSGYSDMAIGLGRIMGFTFPENFNHPYTATSLRDFWRRWHISLSTWFRDYLYIPMGGSRKGPARTLLNLSTVFLVTGLWHGASWNFVVWGLFHGAFIMFERTKGGALLTSTWRPFRHLYTLLVVIVAWVFFRADDMSHAIAFLQRMFFWQIGDPVRSSYLAYFHLDSLDLFIGLIGIMAAIPMAGHLRKYEHLMVAQSIRSLYIMGLLILSIMFLNAGNHNPFIYFRF